MTKKQQQLAAFVFGVVFVITMLALAIFVPNPTSFQYVVFRVVLSLATAGVAAMIPGFIELNIPNWLRAGGALAVFAIVYFYNPASLVVSSRDNNIIEPLKPPFTNHTPKNSSSTFPPFLFMKNISNQIPSLIVSLAEAKDKDASPSSQQPRLSVARLLEGRSKDKASRLFDLIISNSTDSQTMLTKFAVRWRYVPGSLKSIVQGSPLYPMAGYVIDFPVNTADKSLKTFDQPMSPPIVLPAGSVKKPSLATLRVQLHYHILGRSNYHADGWDIVFDIDAITASGDKIQIFKNKNWREIAIKN